jgi:hypothetical protein
MGSEQPQPPESVPKYLAEGVPKQDGGTRRELQEWIDELIAYRADISVDKIEVGDEERLEDVDDTGETTTVIKKVPCGKESCSTCPHGPYRYEVHRDGGSLAWEYKGAVDE